MESEKTTDPLCVLCERCGIVREATKLDHVVPVEHAPDRFWDRSNWQALCRGHHEEKTARENQSRATTTAQGRDWLTHVSQYR